MADDVEGGSAPTEQQPASHDFGVETQDREADSGAAPRAPGGHGDGDDDGSDADSDAQDEKDKTDESVSDSDSDDIDATALAALANYPDPSSAPDYYALLNLARDPAPSDAQGCTAIARM
ncbi:hypothetical protein KEM52_005280 [Ascosphaera acerosa]|nr:hypothetical protein KEM52_005280 [Ascosphaera acerosa]